jgi:glycosyltransferase involved in cell wall biosynthesis
MKILLAGHFFPGSPEAYYARAFSQLGAKVRRFDFGFPWDAAHLLLEPFFNHACLKAYREFAPDLVLVCTGSNIRPETISRMKREGRAQLFCLLQDNPFISLASDPARFYATQAIPYYDCCFSWSAILLKELYTRGAVRASALAFGYDPFIHRPLPLPEKGAGAYEAGIVFSGEWEPQKERWLSALEGLPLRIWGPATWGRRAGNRELRNAWQKRQALDDESALVNSHAKVSVNVLRSGHKDAHNLRTFEVPACGGFLLAERTQEAVSFFAEDKEAVYFSSPEELREKAEYYLAHDEQRRAIAEAGYRRCKASPYSYLDRAQSVLEMFQRYAPSRKKYRLAIVASHVIPYAVPLYRKLAAHPDIELTNYFCSDQGIIRRSTDPGFGCKVVWDTVSIEALRFRLLRNYWPLHDVFLAVSYINPGIFKELRRERFDAVLIVGYGFISYLLAFFAALRSHTPFIISGESPTPWRPMLKKIFTSVIKRVLLPFLLRRAGALFYIGSKAKEFYLQYFPDAEAQKKMFFTPYSVDNEHYFAKSKEYAGRKRELRLELGLPPDYPVILFLSKLIYWKRPLLLLDAFRKMKVPATLAYVGSGQREMLIKEYVAKYHVPRVHLFGFQNYSQTPKFYAAADVLVLPSLGESWGLVVNEAMCSGLPVIITDQVMSGFDLVRDGVNGFVIKKEDRKALIEKLDYMASHPEERERMGMESRRVMEHWNYDRCVEGYLQALRHITGR